MIGTRIPKPLIWAVMLICALPFLLNLSGVDWSLPANTFDSVYVTDQRIDPTVFAGAFTHIILEWIAFSAAFFTALLAFIHFSLRREVTTLVIGIALFYAGTMDAFHTLAITRLIESVAGARELGPFTWAICRLFNALIMMAGVGIFLVRGVNKQIMRFPFVLSICLIFSGIADRLSMSSWRSWIISNCFACPVIARS